MKRILIDRTELMGRIEGIESGCLDGKSRCAILMVKKAILSLPTSDMKEERKRWQE